MGTTIRTPEQADPKSVHATDRGHWSIENSCHYIIDWNDNEERSRDELVMAQKTSLDYDTLPLASSSPKVYAVSYRKATAHGQRTHGI